MSSWIFKTTSVLVCPWRLRLSHAPPDPSRSRDRLTPAPHESTRCHRRKNEPQCQTRRAGGVERSPPGDGLLGPRDWSVSAGREVVLPGTACSVPGIGAYPRGGRGFQHFRRRLPAGAFFVSPSLGFQLYGRLFSGDETFSSPLPGIFFRVPGCLGSAVEQSAQLCTDTGLWFEPRLSSFIFSRFFYVFFFFFLLFFR